MEGILDAIGDDRVAGVSAAIEPGADVVVGCEDVDQLALALVAPLRAEDHAELGLHAIDAGRSSREAPEIGGANL